MENTLHNYPVTFICHDKHTGITVRQGKFEDLDVEGSTLSLCNTILSVGDVKWTRTNTYEIRGRGKSALGYEFLWIISFPDVFEIRDQRIIDEGIGNLMRRLG